MIFRNQDAASGGCEPGVIAEGHVVDLHGYKHRSLCFRVPRFWRHGGFLCGHALARLCYRRRSRHRSYRCRFRNEQSGLHPFAGGLVILHPAAVVQRSPPAAWCRINMLEIGALEARSKSGPGVAAVMSGQESIGIKGQNYQSAFRAFVINGDIQKVLMLESHVGATKVAPPFSLICTPWRSVPRIKRSDVLGIDDDGVDDPVAGSHALPVIFVGGLPQTARRAGVEHLRILGSWRISCVLRNTNGMPLYFVQVCAAFTL